MFQAGIRSRTRSTRHRKDGKGMTLMLGPEASIASRCRSGEQLMNQA
jgi:hypothetical protein